MKKMILLATALLGTVAASQAGVHFDFGVNLPFPGEIILGHRAPAPVSPIISAPPPVVYEPAPATAPVYAPAQPEVIYSQPAPVIAATPVCPPAPQVIYAPPVACPPTVIVAPQPIYRPEHRFVAYRHEDARRWDRRHDSHQRHGRR